MSITYLRRRAAFAAGHAYWLPDKSDEENRRLFGQWASRWGHGHNYIAEVTVAGSVNPTDGMVVNITEVNQTLKTVVGELADKHLTYEVEHFTTIIPTLENIAAYIAARFDEIWTNPDARLTRIVLWESPDLWLTFLPADEKKGMPTMMALTRAIDFAAAHRLHAETLSDAENESLFGKCHNRMGHGHNYGVEVTVVGEPDDVTGMLVDLGALDAVIDREVMHHFDHKHLNFDVPEFAHLNPTSENLVRVIYERLDGKIPAPARLYRVVVRETERNWFEYYGGAAQLSL